MNEQNKKGKEKDTYMNPYAENVYFGETCKEIIRLRSESYKKAEHGDVDKAVELAALSLEKAKKNQIPDQDSFDCRSELADTYQNAAQVYSAAGKHEKAILYASICINLRMQIARTAHDSDSCARLAAALRARERIYIRAGLIELASCDETLKWKLHLLNGETENSRTPFAVDILGDKKRLNRIRAKVDRDFSRKNLGILFPEDHIDYEQVEKVEYLV